ncbi:MAG: FTR1 family iron permease [Candidatus Dormibacteria bacterium]
MVGAFFIFLREGVEGSLIVAILLAYLAKIGRKDLFRDIYLGVISALVLAGAVGTFLYFTVRTYANTQGQTIFETITYILAAGVLTYMTIWLHQHARSLSTELRTKVSVALDSKQRFGLGLLAFQAVGREGLETMVFTLAIVFAQGSSGVGVGGVLGLGLSLVIAFMMYRLGRRINLGRFFTILGVLLTVFAAGLLADAIENLQQLGWIPFLHQAVWHSGHFISENSTFGDILHVFLGYASSPSVLQIGVYLTYVGIVATLLAHSPQHPQSHAAP